MDKNWKIKFNRISTGLIKKLHNGGISTVSKFLNVTKDELLKILDTLNPKNESGKVTLICRMGHEKVSTILPNINTKVNLIYGEDDLVVPIKVGIDSSSIIPDSELTIIPDEGHNMLRSSSEKIIEIIKKWI